MFRKWFDGHFPKFTAQLLVVDGHQSHLDPELVRETQRERVILLCLPPLTSHILQLRDMSFFGPLKADFSGLAGDLSAKGPKRLIPADKGSESGGGSV